MFHLMPTVGQNRDLRQYKENMRWLLLKGLRIEDEELEY